MVSKDADSSSLILHHSTAAPVVDGWIQRIKPDPALASELKRATPGDRVSLYAVNRFWYDALADLSQARQSSPNNLVLANEWVDLLKSVGLEKIAKEPLVH